MFGMTDPPNPYETSETEAGVPLREAKTPRGPRCIWFLLFMVFVVPLALFGLYLLALILYVIFFSGLEGGVV